LRARPDTRVIGVSSAPRLDARLIRYLERATREATAAELTRGAGDLAWELGLPRPSYQAVRTTVIEMRGRAAAIRAPQTSPGQIALKVLGTLYEYPAPGLADWYARYKRGEA
jgi:hypothetical protein